jgi:hypothetical protein
LNFGGGPGDHQATFCPSFWLTALTFLVKCSGVAPMLLGAFLIAEQFLR